MRFIGCKENLLGFIEAFIKEKDIKGNVFCDLFAGTASVGKHFKKLGYKIIATDLLYFSYVLQKVYLEQNQYPKFSKLLNYLKINPVEETLFAGATITQPLMIKEKQTLYTPSEEKLVISHKESQSQVAEIGKLQFYYTETEYSLELPSEKKNLDVVWKREVDGVPTFAFEVELSGMLEKAIERLKFAFRKWNSRPRIIITKEFIKKAHNIITASDKDFSQQIKIYKPVQITELVSKKRELKSVEQNLEIY